MSRLRTPVNQRDHKTGNLKGRITLVEYGDYQCGHCGIAHPLIKQLLEEYGDELLFVFRNFPLQESHPAAMIAAQTAEAADLQDNFWQMHDIIYENQDMLDEDSLHSFSKALNLNIQKLQRDVISENVISRIEADLESGIRSGVNGTPSFFINEKKLDTYDESYESLVEGIKSAGGL